MLRFSRTSDIKLFKPDFHVPGAELMKQDGKVSLLKRSIDDVLYCISMFVAYLFIALFSLLGLKGTLKAGEKIGALLYRFSRMKEKIFLNLKLAYGDDLSQSLMKETARAVVLNFGRNWTEIFYSCGPSKRKLHDNISIEGKQNLEKALASGRGVVAVSAHIGNYAILAPRLTVEGYDFLMVIRDLKSAVSSRVYRRGRELMGFASVTTVPERHFFKTTIKTLQRNGIVCVIADENKRRGGIFVDFFSHPASTAPGPAALALRTGAAVVPIFIVRNDDGSQKIIIEEEIKKTDSGDRGNDLLYITSAYTRVIERYVRLYPSQWLWTNWRWRTQPWGQSDAAKLSKRGNRGIIKRMFSKSS